MIGAPRSRRRFGLTVLALALALVVGLAACGDEEGSDDAGMDATLRVVTTGALDLDPSRAADPAGAMLAALATETLVVLDPDTSEERPGLADSWEVSDDQQRFTFELDPDAVFHDGAPLSAAAVVASLARVVAPETESPLANLLAPVVGFEAAREGDGPPSGLGVDGDHTVVIELDEPRSDFPVHLAHPGLGIVATSGGGVSPVGTGPFVPTELDDDRIELVAADGAETRVGGIEVRSLTDVDAAARAVADGDADLALVGGAEALPDGVLEHRTPILAVSYYGLDVTHPDLADERLRAAVVLAVDPEAVVDAGYGRAASSASSIAPEPLPGVGPGACGDACGPDKERAAALIADVAAGAELPTITIDHDETPVQDRVAAALAGELEAVGLEVELRAHDPDDYDAFLAAGDPMVFRFGWVADVPSARSFLAPVFQPGAPENVTRLESRAVTEAIETADRARRGATRDDAYRDAQRAVLDAGAAVPLAQLVSRYAAGPAVEDLEVTVFGSFVPVTIGVDRSTS